MTDSGDRILDVSGNNAFLIDNPDFCYRVAAGKVDIFSVPISNGQPGGTRRHLFQIETGSVAFGFPQEAFSQTGIGILISGITGTKVQRMARSDTKRLEQENDNAEAWARDLDEWLIRLTDAVLPAGIQKAVDQKILQEGQVILKEGRTFNAEQGVLWVRQMEGRSLFLGLGDFPMDSKGDSLRPVTERSWFTAGSNDIVEGFRSRNLLSLDSLWKSLDDFHAEMLKMICIRMKEAEAAERERISRKAVSDQAALAGSLRDLAKLLGFEKQTGQVDEEDFLITVCRKVADQLGIRIVAPPASVDLKSSKNPLADIVRSSRIRMRRVALQGDWWKEDNGPMVAFLNEGKNPVALLQKDPRSYLLYDPSKGDDPIPITREIAQSLDPFAYVLYRSFPAKVIGGKDILSFALQGRGRDLAVIFAAGLACGLLGLVTPIATGVIFDTIIPGAQLNQLLMLTMALLVGAVSTSVFEFTKGIAILRLQGRMDQHVQSAVWDRLLELPVPFFRNYSSGDLAVRAMGINAVRQSLSETTVSTILSGIFTIFNLALLFWYSMKLAITAVVITLVAVLVLALTSRFQLRYQKQLTEIGGKLSGFVLEAVTGVAKFRVSGSEPHVFAKWTAKFTEQRELARKSRMIQNGISTFSNVYPVISTMTIFIMIVWFTEKEPLSTGDFLAFNASFSQFLQAVLAIVTGIISSLSVIPHYQRFKPILETLPETDAAKAHPGELTGAIEVSHLSFRYSPDGPYILNDISLQVKPGEFIALVGQSGSGKSTLLRLLLGFEQAESGGIFYDGQEISTLDIRSVRQQMGVVLQNGQLLSGDILTNIIGSSMMTVDDAWQAAKMAGFEEDIKAMPMGMYTVVSQGGGTLSGGQRQRLLIARALVAKPHILFFDEATSALDNVTQAVVNSSLERLQTTRVVIAHRLSTIVNADRIYVLDEGRIVQSGTYDELMARQGLFADLAKRQIA